MKTGWRSLVLTLGLLAVMGPRSAWAFGENCPVCYQDGEDPVGWIDDHTTYLDGKLKISGSVRNRVESRIDWDWNDNVRPDYPLDDTFDLFRVRLRADWEALEFARFVGEVQSSHAFEIDNNNSMGVRRGGAAVQDRLDVFQLYTEIHDLENIPQLTIRGGRYTLVYGQQRLIGAFAWSNVGRSFQGARLEWKEDDWWVHGFYNDVVDPFDGHANNNDPNNGLGGIYGQYHGFDWGKVEAYWLFHKQDDIGAASLNGRQTHSFGTLIEAKLLEDKALDVDGEFVYQDGTWLDGITHQAFAMHLGAGYTFKDVAWSPRVGAMYNFATGDESTTDRENNTFDNLFPTNHLHYGSMDRFGWRNMHEVELNVKAKPCKPITLVAEYHAFWLDEPTTAPWLHAGGGVVRGPMAGADDFVGHEIDLQAQWTFYKHLSLTGGYSHFFAEDFVSDTGPSDDGDWWFIETTFKF